MQTLRMTISELRRLGLLFNIGAIRAAKDNESSMKQPYIHSFAYSKQ
jgi:hypothetical protein